MAIKAGDQIAAEQSGLISGPIRSIHVIERGPAVSILEFIHADVGAWSRDRRCTGVLANVSDYGREGGGADKENQQPNKHPRHAAYLFLLFLMDPLHLRIGSWS